MDLPEQERNKLLAQLNHARSYDDFNDYAERSDADAFEQMSIAAAEQAERKKRRAEEKQDEDPDLIEWWLWEANKLLKDSEKYKAMSKYLKKKNAKA